MDTPRYVAVDWGTSSFRLWVRAGNGRTEAQHSSDCGMSRLQPNDFAPYLDKVLSDLSVSPDVPVLICGMAGAKGGWQEIPYAAAPASEEALAAGIRAVAGSRYRCSIMPGVSISNGSRFDVMRGEETLIFGALSLNDRGTVFCLPGTHSKWCHVEGGEIVNFNTAMTGEVFALLSEQSTLASFCLQSDTPPHESPAFAEGARDAIASPDCGLHSLFSIRARGLLNPTDEEGDLRARLSGLLIGQELAGAGLARDATVTLIADERLSAAYLRAFEIIGAKTRVVSAEAAALAGLDRFALRLFAETAIG